jgi:hypothetical protein
MRKIVKIKVFRDNVKKRTYHIVRSPADHHGLWGNGRALSQHAISLKRIEKNLSFKNMISLNTYFDY